MRQDKLSSLNILFIAVAFTVTLSLGACSTAGGGADGAAVGSESTLPGDGTTLSDEEREQLEARDPGFADTSMLVDVYFDFDKSDLKDNARSSLNQNAEWIQANSGIKVQIEGHCDERGTEEYNLALGERRANAVKNYLISLGIDADRLYTISYGEELPVDPRHTEGAWGQNRRSHFLVTQ